MKSVLIFGGSFNPIHLGHLAIGRFVRDELGFERVLFVPNGDAYRKRGLARAAERLRLVELAIADEPAFEARDVEVRSRDKMRAVKTAAELREEFPTHTHELVVLRGVDALPRTHRGHFAIPNLSVLVLGRSDAQKSFDEIVASRPHLEANRDRLRYLPDAFASPHSSTRVREAVAAGLPIDEMVPAAVAAEIARLGLYASPRRSA